MKISTLLRKWKGHRFSSGSYPGEDYLEFQRNYKSVLKGMSTDLKCDYFAFTPNHYCFTAVFGVGSIFAYVSVGDVRTNYFGEEEWHERILYRTMEHSKDWHGGHNQYTELDRLEQSLREILCPHK